MDPGSRAARSTLSLSKDRDDAEADHACVSEFGKFSPDSSGRKPGFIRNVMLLLTALIPMSLAHMLQRMPIQKQHPKVLPL